MRIGILYVCTGIYEMFWKDFFISAEEKFMPGAQKEYFVFTDADSIYGGTNSNVHKIYQKDLGWPGNTLFRFKMFKKCFSEYNKCDYLFFCNANMLFVREVGEEILSENELIVVQHPGYWNKSNVCFQYDRNTKSNAYIPYGEGLVYVMGGFNGGRTSVYKNLIDDLEAAIDDDYKKGIIAQWHDESHLNKYILSHPYKLLDAGYGYPQGWYRFPFEKRIMLRDKVICGGRRFIQKKHWGIVKQIRYYISFALNMMRKH